MSDDDDARYQEILRRIAAQKQQQALAPTRALLTSTLDSLNAASLLTEVRRKAIALSVCGPATFQGTQPDDSGTARLWLASAIWHKPAGYGGYQTLGLIGIWALQNAEGLEILLGEKALTYNSPIFNPESYYYHIRRRFDLYYEGDARPPESDGIRYRTPYAAERRLTIRAELAAALRTWTSSYDTPD
ncbi:MAG: hypothetical protein K8I60_19645 [Anaerolineae bacterium]|nr:hypothetical protein [Anaerolineae bacterium]